MNYTICVIITVNIIWFSLFVVFSLAYVFKAKFRTRVTCVRRKREREGEKKIRREGETDRQTWLFIDGLCLVSSPASVRKEPRHLFVTRLPWGSRVTKRRTPYPPSAQVSPACAWWWLWVSWTCRIAILVFKASVGCFASWNATSFVICLRVWVAERVRNVLILDDI